MDIDSIRSDFPLVDECRYFNTGGIAPSPAVVTTALIDDFTETAQHGPLMMMDPASNTARLTETRRKIAHLCKVDMTDLCLTRGVSDGVSIVFNGFDWKEGDELIITDEEHPTVQVPADYLAAARGVTLKHLPVSGDAEQILQRLRGLLTSRTRLLTLSHVTTDTGTRLPAAAICRIAHEHDIPVMLDGAQSLGQFPVDVSELGADFYGILGYKWLFGPHTAGALYIAKPWQRKLWVGTTGAHYYQATEGVRRFEFGSMSVPLYHATTVAIGYIQGIGIPEIERRAARLTDYLRTALKRVPGLTVESPEAAEMSTGMIAFRVTGVDGKDLNAGLKARKIITRPTFLKFSGVRISVAFYNTEEELDAVVNAVAEIVRAKR